MLQARRASGVVIWRAGCRHAQRLWICCRAEVAHGVENGFLIPGGVFIFRGNARPTI